MNTAVNTITHAMAAVKAEAARINIPGRLERLPMTAYQKRLFCLSAR